MTFVLLLCYLLCSLSLSLLPLPMPLLLGSDPGLTVPLSAITCHCWSRNWLGQLVLVCRSSRMKLRAWLLLWCPLLWHPCSATAVPRRCLTASVALFLVVVVPGTALMVVARDRRGIGLVSDFLIKIHLQGVDDGVIVIGLTNSEEGCRTHLQVRIGGQARSWKWTNGGKAKSQETQINSKNVCGFHWWRNIPRLYSCKMDVIRQLMTVISHRINWHHPSALKQTTRMPVCQKDTIIIQKAGQAGNVPGCLEGICRERFLQGNTAQLWPSNNLIRFCSRSGTTICLQISLETRTHGSVVALLSLFFEMQIISFVCRNISDTR